MLSISYTKTGHAKISIFCDYDGERYTRGVAKMVAEAFVKPPTPLCTQVVMLDGNLDNLVAENLIWRPVWFAWKYTRQLKVPQPSRYENLMVKEIYSGNLYHSIIDAGMTEGLLFDDIWRSTYSGARIYPHGMTFEVVK
jgi:hypothetical protein